MKKFLKIITLYDFLYPFYKKSFLYQFIKKTYAQIANMMSGFPSKDFVVIGVTGTDGKTTTSNILHKIINDNLGKTLMISTAYIKLGDQKIFNKTKMTSLDVFDLQGYLSTAKDSGCQYAVLEVSSHALDQFRFEGVEFDGAVLTNITPEHLDYHGTLENYANTKRKLFEYVATNSKNNKRAALPKDDEFGRKRADEIGFDKMMSFSINSSSMLRATNIQLSLEKTVFTLQYLGKEFQITTGLLGEHNVYNILAATAMGILMGIDLQKIIASIQSFEGVSGRLEYIDIKGVHVFVDFAHTPNALESTLKFFKTANKSGRLITVFGAPGKRDKYKRPLMGEIADRYSHQ
ncbi:MAG TPA: UDP-N-acetylmuramyl-tripeptide synthetase, partial [Candidatus Absconditabacterales bacterium]|nr:UDP-N-acetylmuramyl-tripeptide synthetase [Candidatus Absconditabacterales bacterium]